MWQLFDSVFWFLMEVFATGSPEKGIDCNSRSKNNGSLKHRIKTAIIGKNGGYQIWNGCLFY